MDNVVYLNHKANELDNLIKGLKTMIIRGAMGRKLPYGKVYAGDVLYFIENNGDGLVKAKAIVQEVYNSEQLNREESIQLISKYQDKLLLDKGMMNKFKGKRYLVLISLKDFMEIEPFKIDKSAYGNMDDWLPVKDISGVSIKYMHDSATAQSHRR
jgi:hypothetical protein